ncbi:SAM-dependent methyltransferase [Candidatus Pelagibacter sp.]|nr:SAM-dependent methyltransferase [Candidatus Pelagibacter sp.]
MKFKKNNLLSLDKFIEESLYNKKFGYYMKSNPFGVKGDFITAPNISILFSEMIAIWIISFWENLDCPKKFNLVELGAGNGEMMKTIINTFNKFPQFKNCCNIKILEKSKLLKKIQKKTIGNQKVRWLDDLNELNNLPCIFIANEFFDALPIKQFLKIKSKWYERYVTFNNKNKPEFLDIPFEIKKLEKKIKFKISSKQKFIEFSPLALEYLKNIVNKIKLNKGGILLIDYGYNDKEMKNTLQAISKHKYIDILNGFGNSDITYNLSFNLISQIIRQSGSFFQSITTQREFLTKLGILKRAEIITKNILFSKKADIYFRLKRLIDKNQMGNLFKVMFVSNKQNKFKLGF